MSIPKIAQFFPEYNMEGFFTAKYEYFYLSIVIVITLNNIKDMQS